MDEETLKEKGASSEITVKEIGWNRTEKIKILGDSVIENNGEQTFHIGTNQDVSPIVWTNNLFRLITSFHSQSTLCYFSVTKIVMSFYMTFVFLTAAQSTPRRSSV